MASRPTAAKTRDVVARLAEVLLDVPFTSVHSSLLRPAVHFSVHFSVRPSFCTSVCLLACVVCVCVRVRVSCLWDMLVQTCYQLFSCVQSQIDTRGKNKWRWPRCKLKLSGKNYLYFLTIFNLIYSLLLRLLLVKYHSVTFHCISLIFRILMSIVLPQHILTSVFLHVRLSDSRTTHPSVCLSSSTPFWRAYNKRLLLLAFILLRLVSCMQNGRRRFRNRTGIEERGDSGCDRWALSPPNSPLTSLTSTSS